MTNIRTLISQLDELREKAGNRDITINYDVMPNNCALFVKHLVENYESLRTAALEGEKYKEAGEKFKTSIIKALNDNDDWGYLMDDCNAALSAYRTACGEEK